MTSVELPLEHETVPPRADPDGTAPAVVVLHGRGADERDLIPLARELPETFRIVSLRAPDPMGPGYTWYEFDLVEGNLHSSQPVEADFRRSLDLVDDSVSAAIEAYDLDPDRIGLLGFSQGTIMSFSLLLEDPDRYAWCVGLHGYLAESHADLEPDGIQGTPVFVGAGERDEIIPAARAKRAADRLAAVGCRVTYRAYDVGHGVGRAELDDVVAWADENVPR